MERRPILVVNDDELIRICVELALADEGYPVVTASNGAVALQVVEQHQPALILLDMKMPTTDGWTFAQAYHQQPGPHAPIVVMTAADAARCAAEVCAEAHLSEPFDLSDLLNLVGRMMRKPQIAGELTSPVGPADTPGMAGGRPAPSPGTQRRRAGQVRVALASHQDAREATRHSAYGPGPLPRNDRVAR